MRSRLLVALTAAATLLITAGAYSATVATFSIPPAVPGTSSNFQLVGHNPLYHRGMNAAAAIFGNYLYVGNRSDGSNTCPDGSTGCAHSHPGILILNISDPAEPDIVGEIGPPFAGNVGITTRELRVWPQQKLLMVMTFRCSHVIHACPAGNDTTFPFNIEFFDVSDPVHPKFIESYVPTSAAGRAVKPHEMYLWADPNNPQRALLFISTPTISTNPAIPNLMIVDISQVPGGGPVKEVAEGNWNDLYPGTNQPNYPFDPASPTGCGPYDCNLIVHSMAPTADGKTTFLAMEAGQFLALDTRAVVNAPSPPTSVINLHNDLLTNPANRPVWEQTPPDPAAVPANCLRPAQTATRLSLSPARTTPSPQMRSTGLSPTRASAAPGDGSGSSTSPTRPTPSSSASTRSPKTSSPSAVPRAMTRPPSSSLPTPPTTRPCCPTSPWSTGTLAASRPSTCPTRRTRPRPGSSCPSRSTRSHWKTRHSAAGRTRSCSGATRSSATA
jgi:hypothetical protein